MDGVGAAPAARRALIAAAVSRLLTGGSTRSRSLGAHCDDIAIGMGGTLLTLAAANPGLRVHALVLTGGGTEREAEERAALARVLPRRRLELTVLDVPDGRRPRTGSVKDALADFRRSCDPRAGVRPAPRTTPTRITGCWPNSCRPSSATT